MKLRPTLVMKSFFSIAGLVLGLASGAAQAVTYSVNIDTRSIAGTSGSVDFQWNLGVVDPLLVASVFSFSSGSTFTDAPVILSGDVSGSLQPGASVKFAGSSADNYLYQNLSFGNAIHFQLTLPDRAPAQAGTDYSSGFLVSVLDSNLAPALPTSARDGTAMAFTLEPSAAPMFAAFTRPGVVQATEVSPVPEPTTVVLLLAGLVAIAGLRGKGALRHRSARESFSAQI